MHKRSMWWFFLLLFAFVIGGIHSLGWWTRHASAQTQTAPASASCCPDAKLTCEPKHWRSLVMHQ
jgi:hypothetical protein